MAQGIRSAAKARYAGEPDEKERDEAAAKDEDHDKLDKGNQVKRWHGRKQQLVGQ